MYDPNPVYLMRETASLFRNRDDHRSSFPQLRMERHTVGIPIQDLNAPVRIGHSDGSTGKPEHLFDNSSTTFLSLVKPGKSYSGCTAGGKDEPIYFVVDMQTQQTFNYFTWSHRSNNSSNYLRVWGISMFGSNDGQNFTEIKSNIAIPYESNADEILIDIPESTYRYVKVQYTNWSDLNGVTGGSTMQVAEFGRGLKL